MTGAVTTQFLKFNSPGTFPICSLDAGQERTGISLEGSSRAVARAAACSVQCGSRSTKIRNQSSRLISGQTTSGDRTPSRSRSG